MMSRGSFRGRGRLIRTDNFTNDENQTIGHWNSKDSISQASYSSGTHHREYRPHVPRGLSSNQSKPVIRGRGYYLREYCKQKSEEAQNIGNKIQQSPSNSPSTKYNNNSSSNCDQTQYKSHCDPSTSTYCDSKPISVENTVQMCKNVLYNVNDSVNTQKTNQTNQKNKLVLQAKDQSLNVCNLNNTIVKQTQSESQNNENKNTPFKTQKQNNECLKKRTIDQKLKENSKASELSIKNCDPEENTSSTNKSSNASITPIQNKVILNNVQNSSNNNRNSNEINTINNCNDAIKILSEKNCNTVIKNNLLPDDVSKESHQHTLHCRTAVCVQDVESFIPKDHLATLQKWVAHIKKVWQTWKQGDFFNKSLVDFFETFQNPYSSTIYLLVQIPGEKSKQTKTFFLTILNIFKDWISPRSSMFSNFINNDLKYVILKKTIQLSCMNCLELVRDAFQCDSVQSWLLSEVQCMKKDHKYREIMLISQVFDLFDRITIFDYLVPFVFQNKLCYVEEGLVSSRQHQLALLNYLDNMLSNESSNQLYQTVQQIACAENIPEVKFETLQAKPMRKLIMRLMKQFDIPQDTCSKSLQRKNQGALAYIVDKYYHEKSFNQESWREMALDIVGFNKTLQEELVWHCVQWGDSQEAYYWCKTFNLDQSFLGIDLTEQIKLEKQVAEDWANWDVCDREADGHFYSLNLPRDQVTVVDTSELFKNFIQQLTRLNHMTPVGVDAEWKPMLTKGGQPLLALIQIATSSHIYLIDMITLATLPNYNELCQELLLMFFGNDHLLKIGFNLLCDLTIITASLPMCDSIGLGEKNFLDLSLLWNKLIADVDLKLPFHGTPSSSSQSLSALVSKCFGKTLNKQEQFSNWENRPLRESQIVYAALDAFCLIEAYSVICNQCVEQNIDVNPFVQQIMSQSIVPPSKKKKTKKKKKNLSEKLVLPPPPNEQPVTVKDVLFMCDTMLKSLARMMRKHGIDTTTAESNHTDCIDAVKRGEKRYLLTRGHVYSQLAEHVPPGHCLRIDSQQVDEQFEEVLSYYNIILPSTLQSRCEECNCSEFCTIDNKTANDLFTKIKTTPNRLCDDFNQKLNISHDDLDDDYDDWDPYVLDEEDDDTCDFAAGPPITKNISSHEQSSPNEQVDLLSVGYTHKGHCIKIEDVPLTILQERASFDICEECGTVLL